MFCKTFRRGVIGIDFWQPTGLEIWDSRAQRNYGRNRWDKNKHERADHRKLKNTTTSSKKCCINDRKCAILETYAHTRIPGYVQAQSTVMRRKLTNNYRWRYTGNTSTWNLCRNHSMAASAVSSREDFKNGLHEFKAKRNNKTRIFNTFVVLFLSYSPNV